MSSFFIVLNKLITLFLMLILGFIARKKNIMSEQFTSGLSKFIMYICLPCLSIMTFQVEFSSELLHNGIISVIITSALFIVSMIIGIITASIFKVPSKIKGIWIFACVFSNSVFMGWPVLEAVFGGNVLLYAAFMKLPYSVFCYTLGIFLIAKFGNSEKDAKIDLTKILKMPSTIAVIIGLIFFSINFKIPESVASSFRSIGNMTTPLAMIYTGAVLSKNKFSKIFSNKYVYLLSALRLAVLPFITYFLLKFLPLDSVIFGAITLMAAMPAANIQTIFASEFGGDIEFSSIVVSVSILLSLITIPIAVILIV